MFSESAYRMATKRAENDANIFTANKIFNVELQNTDRGVDMTSNEPIYYVVWNIDDSMLDTNLSQNKYAQNVLKKGD